MPDISIVMPIYNGEEYIFKSIESIIIQTYFNWELIIVDDCSSDNSRLILNSFAETDSRIKLYINSSNMGPAYSRNLAIEKASGKYVAFLDSDDIWMPSKLEKQFTFMENNKYLFSYTQYAIIDENDNFIKLFKPRNSVNYNAILKTCDIGCSTVMYNAGKLGKHYMENIKRGQDYTLWLKLLKITKTANCICEDLTKYRIRANSLSRNKFKKARGQWFIYRAIEKLSFGSSIWYFCQYAVYGFLKNRKF